METIVPVIETRGLTKTYKGVQALQALDLKVTQNSICGFLGPNGAGKTTTIKLLLGLARPTGGGKVFGLDIVKENDQIRRRVGYLQLLKPAGGTLTPLRIAEVMGLSYLNLLFFLTLALMLATFFNGRGPVLGISLVLAWAGPMPFVSAPIQKYAPWLYDVLPWKMLIDFNTNQPLVIYLANGQPLPTVTPIIATALWCVLFTAVAIWRMSREEF